MSSAKRVLSWCFLVFAAWFTFFSTFFLLNETISAVAQETTAPPRPLSIAVPILIGLSPIILLVSFYIIIQLVISDIEKDLPPFRFLSKEIPEG